MFGSLGSGPIEKNKNTRINKMWELQCNNVNKQQTAHQNTIEKLIISLRSKDSNLFWTFNSVSFWKLSSLTCIPIPSKYKTCWHVKGAVTLSKKYWNYYFCNTNTLMAFSLNYVIALKSSKQNNSNNRLWQFSYILKHF